MNQDADEKREKLKLKLQKEVAELASKKRHLEEQVTEKIAFCRLLDKKIEIVKRQERSEGGWRKLRETFSQKQVNKLRLRTSVSRSYSGDDVAMAWTMQNLMMYRSTRADKYIRHHMKIPLPTKNLQATWRKNTKNVCKRKNKVNKGPTPGEEESMTDVSSSDPEEENYEIIVEDDNEIVGNEDASTQVVEDQTIVSET